MKMLLGVLLLIAFGLLAYRGMLERGAVAIPQPRVRRWRCRYVRYQRIGRSFLVIGFVRA